MLAPFFAALLLQTPYQQPGAVKKPNESSPPTGDTVGYWQQRVHYRIVSRLDEAATGDHGLSLLLYALRSRELSLIDQALLEESMIEFLDLAVAEFKAVRLDPDLLPDARSFAATKRSAGFQGSTRAGTARRRGISVLIRSSSC